MKQENNIRRMYGIYDDNNALAPLSASILCQVCNKNVLSRSQARGAVRVIAGPVVCRRDFVDVTSHKSLTCESCGYRSDEAQYRLRDLTQILLTFEGEEERKMMAQVGFCMYEVQGIDTETCDDFVTLRLMRASEFDYLTRKSELRPVPLREVRPVYNENDRRKWGLILLENGVEVSNMWMFSQLQRDLMIETIIKDKDTYFQIFADLEREMKFEDEEIASDPELQFMLKRVKDYGRDFEESVKQSPHETTEGLIHRPQMASIDGLAGDIIDIVVSHIESEHDYIDLSCCTNPDSDKHDNIYGKIHDEMVARLCPSVPVALVKQVAEAYAEKRSDVTDMLEGLIETGKVDLTLAEHRFAEMTLPVALSKGTLISYDTLTTLFRIVDPDTMEDVIDAGAIDVDYAD